MSIGGLIAGTEVEVCQVERQPNGDLLVGLITSPPTWVFMRAGKTANDLERLWESKFTRVCIPMPPQHTLTTERPALTGERS